MTDFITTAAPRAVFERYLKRSEEKLLLAHIAKHVGLYARRDHAWIRLMRFSGLRLGSVRGLSVGAVKLALRTRRLHADKAFAKGGRGYDAPLNSGTEQALRDLLKIRKAMRQPDDDDAPLVCSRTGQGMAERTYQQRLQMWRLSSGVGVEVSPHWLRHTLAKRVMASSEAVDKLGVVQALLGQASRASAVVYTMPDREDLEQASESACR